LVAPVWVQHSTPEGSGGVAAIREGYQPIQSAIVDDRVRIQNENIFATARGDAGVISPRKTQVLMIFDDTHPRVVLPDEFDGTVDRPVVGNNDFKVRRVRTLMNRAQAVTDNTKIIPADDYD
jgi:hypothetical protein